MPAISKSEQNTEFDKHEQLNVYIKSLEDWGMPPSDLKQIVWEWNQGRQIWEFHNSPKKIIAIIDAYLSQFGKSNLSIIVNSLSVRL